jgi:ferredoxin--NADP+ reductase
LLEVRLDTRHQPRWQPGQHVVLRPPGTASRHRSYSIAGVREGNFEFCIKLAGATSTMLSRCPPGTVLQCSAPHGSFTLNRLPPEAQQLVLVSTGSGIAPFMAMLRDPAFWQRGWQVSLWHGVRRMQAAPYHAELTGLAAGRPRQFAYQLCVSGEAGQPAALPGRVTSYLATAAAASPAGTHWLLCGAPAMVEDSVSLLHQAGFMLDQSSKRGSVHCESF